MGLQIVLWKARVCAKELCGIYRMAIRSPSVSNGGKPENLMRGAYMKFFSANLDSLRKLYIDQIQQLHSAETQITEALPKMIKAATEPQLKQALETHLQETRGQVSRLEQILQQA